MNYHSLSRQNPPHKLPNLNKKRDRLQNSGILEKSVASLETELMCESPPDPMIPDWINTYESVDDNDGKLLANFRKLYHSLGNSEAEERAIKRICNQVLPYLKNYSKHQDYSFAISQTLMWLHTPLIVLTDDLKKWLKDYGDENDHEICDKLLNHLTKLDDPKLDPKEYRQAERYTRYWTEKLTNYLQENDTDLYKELQSRTQRMPRICYVNPGEPSLLQTLIRWIKSYISFRVRDLYVEDSKADDSLYTPISSDDSPGEELITQVVEDPSKLPTLTKLNQGKLFNESDSQEYRELLLERDEYLRNDPDKLLASRHIPKYPDLTYKVLAERLILKHPSDDIREIAREFGIFTEEDERLGRNTDQMLYSQVSRNFLPLIAAIPLLLGNQPEAVRQAIENDSTEELTKTRGNPGRCQACTTQFLAMRLLPMFVPAGDIFARVVQHLQAEGESVKTELLAIYSESSFAVFALIADALNEQGLEIGSYDVLAIWETATIQTVTTELQPQCRQLTFEQVQAFWQDKCLTRLGKLAIHISKQENEGNS